MRKDIRDTFYIQIVPTVYFTDIAGNALPDRTAASKRKQIARAWQNHEWYMRLQALTSFLSDGSNEIAVGELEDSVRIAVQPVVLLSPTSIDEMALADASPYISFGDEDSEEDATDVSIEGEDSGG